ncbi:membrane fusion protein, macrolide-specific efflux system [Andreprevotia lacus DSM 23236]|jgi:macrolide-specific efflux system membrane fusion protein|uniref:Membrane fusion protein, macrolide-specific efflux system n=1 Tax=Andreprevotia lacus DSM 23236 TaxID=1121001 RepID=A0A1W1XVV4_9NEIS|nr:macrolide transporter subunit MacA [Andreprevotia lacus]SMC27964.1 membrane fusion protein, macrolide-specific efflux system [Andreprevotia lacus DSM 23236]
MTVKKRVFWLVLVLLIGAGIFWLVQRSTASAPPPQYLTTPVSRMDLEEAVLASGTLEPATQVNVGAQVNGQLKSLKVKLGDSVKKGQLLAEIDPAIQQNELRNAEAGLQSIEAQRRAKTALLHQYELALQRQQQMARNDASPQAELESAQAQVDATRAELAALDAQIQQSRVQVDTAQTNLGYTRIVAPIDGEVIAVVTKEGQTVVSAQSAPTILVLANLGTMTVKAQISEADVVRVKPGLPVYFSILGAPERRFDARLRAVEPAPESIGNATSSSGSTTSTAVYYNGLFDVANPDRVLRTSMTTQVSIVQGSAKGVLAVPASVLGAQDKDGRFEVKVLKDGKPQPRKIRVGLNNHVNVQVLEGLAEGEKVLVSDGPAPGQFGPPGP